MTAVNPAVFSRRERSRRRARPQWRRAFRALRLLLGDPDRTEHAFEVIAALDPDLMERGLAALLARPEGRRLFVERPSLLEHLGDRAALARMPEGSLGRAYLAHIDRYGLDPGKLVALGRSYECQISSDDEGVRWYADRSELSHDLAHVLSGHGADPFGETALLWFSYGASGGRGNALLMLGAALRTWREAGLGWPLLLFREYRRGRRVGCVPALPFERLLAAPLDDVRRAAGL